ncbi:Ape3 vacuolar aminopeptidase Y [Candida orthopsilosis Co 90-125]|uniref:Peptide hydrolase n=1 Tax=Candida orthopsilosis (strain 90-125) TaxID=1136231 RepID=H8X3V3_CANO9|nr:Ape3 vacuolar aminopeptidase Y [Candida orthopsilosis Co 90-125]CCG25741.1 Ape3 vacuolar aminopeptidase Y [Candida orthopsilosis Co 90-125]
MKYSVFLSIAIASTVDAFPTLKFWQDIVPLGQQDQTNQAVLVNSHSSKGNEEPRFQIQSIDVGQEEVSPQYEESESITIDDIIDESTYLKLPEIDSELLQESIDESNLKKRAESLFKIANYSTKKYGHPTRVIGSPGHWATIRYIISELKKLGGYYTIKTQSFDAIDGHIESYSLLIDGVQPKSLKPLALTPPTTDKRPAHGNLVLVESNGCSLHDYPHLTKDNIVLIKRGECSFGDKSRNAGKLGAKGAIIYDSQGAVSGTLGTPSGEEVATVAVDEKDVDEYIKKLKTNPNHKFETTLYVDAYVKNISTINVVADTVFGDHDNIVSLGAHSDSVGAGPGINDDGSGTISLLEVAKQLTKYKINNAVRFAWWAAEEEGLLGSTYYANHLSKSDNKKLRLFMDYDMMASPNYEYEVYDANNKDHPNGSGNLRDLYIDWYTTHGLNYTLVPFDGRSDYVGFIDQGIPAGGIATGAEKLKDKEAKQKFGGDLGKAFDPCYHQLCDDLSNPSYEAWGLNTKLIAHSVATYAKTFDGFPKRDEGKDKVQQQSIGNALFTRRGDLYVI